MKNINLNADKVSINNSSLENYLNNNNAVINNNANLDLSNLNENGKKAFLPSETYIELDKSLRTYSPPANGYLVWKQRITDYTVAGWVTCCLNGHHCLASYTYSASGGLGFASNLIVQKEKTYILSTTNATLDYLRFYYAEGEI